MNYIDLLFAAQKNTENTHMRAFKRNSQISFQCSLVQEHIPSIKIQNERELEKNLEEYLNAYEQILSHFLPRVYSSPEKKAEHLLFSLYKDMTKSDFSNVESYVKMRTQFLTDDTFANTTLYPKPAEIEHGILIRAVRERENRGCETPFSMRFLLDHNNELYSLPRIYYGVFEPEGEKTACIYAVQNPKMYTYTPPSMIKEEIESVIRKINSGINHFRDCQPRKVLALSLFFNELHKNNIKKIIVPIGLPVRQYMRSAFHSTEELEAINKRITVDFARLFQRLEFQIKGVKIVQNPNELSSYLKLECDDKLQTKNKLLQSIYGFEKISPIIEHNMILQ